MKKLAICCLVLALAAIFVPTSQASPRCITFTNFCDQIQYDTTVVGGVTGTVFYGDWDWFCTPGSSTSIIGNGGSKLKVATRPVYYTYTFAYTAGFTFRKSDHLFDLMATTGLAGGALYFQYNQPWTQAGGTCGFAKPSNGKPRLTAK